MFSIMGEALDFGARRLGLVARVAWLPIVLLLLVNMASVFAQLSVIAGETITFTQIPTLLQAEQYLTQYSERGWAKAPGQMGAILAINLILQIILLASFLAPLIRYAGLGDRPNTSLIRLPFGADQVRFIGAALASWLFLLLVVLLPIASASFFTMQYINDAMSQTMASFPDETSLHTIEIVSSGQGMIERGAAWMVDLALPLAAAAPFALIAWAVGFWHFHPRNRPSSGERRSFALRALAVLAGLGVIVGGAFWLARGAILQSLVENAEFGAAPPTLTGTPIVAMLIFGILGALLLVYFNIRLFAYPGVAVCRRSLAPGPALAVSRGWNLFRLTAVLVLLWLLLLAMQIVINAFALPMVLSVLNTLFQATAVSTKLVNSGAVADWVLPLFVWMWNATKIAVNLGWAFFSYGVLACLYGRLYRESLEAV